jgi:hypothetical protein
LAAFAVVGAGIELINDEVLAALPCIPVAVI